MLEDVPEATHKRKFMSGLLGHYYAEVNMFKSATLEDAISLAHDTEDKNRGRDKCPQQFQANALSHWCIFHRKKARQVVETWDREFRGLPKEQRVPFLYLANDILQNSRRRGGEFVTEFWRILPGALKDAIEKGGEHAQSVVLRLVDIWDERKVFGTRTRSLREELLGNDPPADLPKEDPKTSQSIKIKVPVGGIQEKLTSAYSSLHDVSSDEDTTLGRCNAAVARIDGLEKEWNTLQSSGVLQGATTIAEELQEQQNVLSHCIEQLEMSQMARASLASQLKEALREQELKLESIQIQLQIAQGKAEHSVNLKKQVSAVELAQQGQRESGPDVLRESPTNQQQVLFTEGKLSWPHVSASEIMAPIMEESKKPKTAATIAAEVAAKLAASTSSVQVLQSVLSSLAAEEASKLRTAISPLDGAFPQDKRQRVDLQIDHIQNAEAITTMTPNSQHLPTLQTSTFASQQQPMEQQLPPPPPLPPLQPQYMSISGNADMQTFGLAGNPSLPHPPAPMQGHAVRGVPHMGMHPQNFNHGPYQTLQPPTMRFYNQPPLPTPNIPRQ